MSWQASAWAANVPHGMVGYVAFRTLALLANDAKEDGSATWLEASTIAGRLDVSKRTVERALTELRTYRLIQYGEQRHVQHLPANKRPPVYDLTMLPAAALRAHAELVRAGATPLFTDLSTGPTELSAPTAGVGPKLSTGPTAVVAVSKEEPPLTPIKTLRGNHRTHAPELGPCPGRSNGADHDFRGIFEWCDFCQHDRAFYATPVGMQ